MSDNTRKAERKAKIAAARAARQNMFNPEVQLKIVKVGNLVEAPGNIYQIPISNKTKNMQEINSLSPENMKEIEKYGLLPQDKGVILPSDPVFRAENLANTQSTKSSSTPNKWFESGKGYIINPRETWQNRRNVLSQTRGLDGRPTTPTARSRNNAQRASELARTIHNKQVKRYSSVFSSNPLSSVRRVSTSQLPVETPTSAVNPIARRYPLGRGPRTVGSSRKKKRAHKTATRKIKSSKH